MAPTAHTLGVFAGQARQLVHPPASAQNNRPPLCIRGMRQHAPTVQLSYCHACFGALIRPCLHVDTQVYGLPLNAYTYHLIYRKDIFEQYNITMPRTWRELLDFARQYNGTAGMHAFCGNWSPCYIGKTYLFM